MKLTTKGRYAVTAMVDLAAHGGERPVALAEIAARQRISLSYLEQLFAKLRRAGLVRSARGPGGGYRLQRVAADTRIADIVRAVDDPIECDTEVPEACWDDLTRHLTAALWQAMNDHIRRYLGTVSLAHVLERRVLDVAAAPLMAASLVSKAGGHEVRPNRPRRP